MGSYGKWIGGGLGWAFGGPIGALLGFVFGSMFDSVKVGEIAVHKTRPADFSVSLMILAAAVMKADNKVVKSELEYVRTFFIHNFGSNDIEERMLFLRDVLKQDIQLYEVCNQISYYMEYSSKLQLLHFLFGIALADKELHPREIEVIQTISSYLNISANDFESIRSMFIKDIDSAYKVLEITPEASDEEIKKAYRVMAKKHHPDKVAHLGEEYLKAANEKFQKINIAYEEIKKQRNLN